MAINYVSLSLDQNFAITKIHKDAEYFLNIKNLLVKCLKKYKKKLIDSHDDQEPSEHKILLIGQKYRKEDAIE